MEKNYFTNLNNFDKILNTYFQRRSYLLKGDNGKYINTIFPIYLLRK